MLTEMPAKTADVSGSVDFLFAFSGIDRQCRCDSLFKGSLLRGTLLF